MKNFQTIVLIVFIIAAVFGILVFSGTIPLGGGDVPGAGGIVTLWGTIRGSSISSVLEEFNGANPGFSVKYEEKAPETFDQDLLEALAEGRGPDLFFLPDNLAYHYQNKILAVPYENFPLATFQKTFAGAGEVFLTSRGTLALPVLIDPLVMYYSRSMLDSNAIAKPPETWSELLAMLPKLTQKTESQAITQSAVALGQFVNVAHAKDILAALFMQTGNPIVTEGEGLYTSVLGETAYRYKLPDVLKFYTNFADPLSPVYSWNRSFESSNQAFSSEHLAFYFGLASELPTLVAKNPNQNFLVTPLPQVKDAKFKVTGARVIGIAVSAFSRNLNTALFAANKLATEDFSAKLAFSLGLAPARRDLLARPGTDAYSPIFYSTALYARTWLDPSPRDTNNIFRTMVENVLSNALSPADAIIDADTKLNLLILKNQ
ncbi:MAG: extracellular solute-binding protein [Patescibacteria group bacterium]